jgi:hypothetical protein
VFSEHTVRSTFRLIICEELQNRITVTTTITATATAAAAAAAAAAATAIATTV